MGFFQGFNLDTCIALISCIASIIALFLGGKAYSNCKLNKNDIKAKKILKDSSTDKSMIIGGDYTYNGVSETGLMSVMETMSQMTSHTFSVALDRAYVEFQLKCDENLHQIIEETQKIVEEHKLDIAGYSKIDWIHIYFESAKNTSDTYMQSVWAKVLAKELSEPNSFSYKTLDILKNMSVEEFVLFEKLTTLSVNNIIVSGEYLKRHGFYWLNLQKLKEYGLISLDGSERTVTVNANDKSHQIINNQFVLLFQNEANNKYEKQVECYLLTNVAKELLKIVSETTSESLAKDIALKIQENMPSTCKLSLHKINYYYYDEERTNINYESKNILDA